MRVSCQISWAVAALSLLCAFSGASAVGENFYTNMHFSALASPGQSYYMEAKDGALRINKGNGAAEGDDAFNMQAFTVSSGFPSQPFTIYNQDGNMYLDATNGTLVLTKKATGAPSQLWKVNLFGQIEASNGMVLAVKLENGYAKKFTPVYLSKSTHAAWSVGLVWVIVPNVTPAKHTFRVVSIANNTYDNYCLDAAATPVPGKLNSPTLSKCQAGKASQVVETIYDPRYYNASYGVTEEEWNWPVATFQIRFKSTGLCLGTIANLYISSPYSSQPYFLTQVNCNNPQQFPMMSWFYNSRGQLQAYYTNMVCMQSLGNVPTMGSCTRVLPEPNRWMFTPA